MKEAVNEIRADISRLEQNIRALKIAIATADLTLRSDVPKGADPADRNEMLANATLAYRHLEDARMRLGKVIQAYDGGVSVYDRKPPA